MKAIKRAGFLKITALMLSAIAAAAAFSACAGDEPTRGHTYFEGKDIAVITGVLTYGTAEAIGANPVEYADSETAIEAVRSGEVEGYMHALAAIEVTAEELGDEFEVIPVPKSIFSAEIGGFSGDAELIGRFDEFFEEITADGTLDEIHERWFGSGRDLSAAVPAVQNSGANGSLTVATCSDSSAPFVFARGGGGFSGYSIELALRFGAYLEKTIVFEDMEFAALISNVSAGDSDFGIANMAITEARKASVTFTTPIYDEGHGILALRK